MLYSHKNFLFLFILTLLSLRSEAQTYSITSISPDLTILLNNKGLSDYGFGYTIDHAPANIEFGMSVQRRHYSLKGKPLSFEYGLRLHKSSTRMEVRGRNGEKSNPTLHTVGLGVPLRIFYDGYKKGKGFVKSQSGLFVELLNSAYFKGDVAKNVYTSHLSLGARTKGRVVYFQFTFGWPILTTDTVFSELGQGFVFKNNERRFSFLTLGYSFPH